MLAFAACAVSGDQGADAFLFLIVTAALYVGLLSDGLFGNLVHCPTIRAVSGARIGEQVNHANHPHALQDRCSLALHGPIEFRSD